MGVYSSLQFLGIFVGGVVGGLAHQRGGDAGVFAITAAIALLWLFAAATMAQPSYLTTRLIAIGDGKAGDAENLAARLRQVPGVAEAVVIAEEKLAYLKVDSRSFDAPDGGSVGRRALRPRKFARNDNHGRQLMRWTGLPEIGLLPAPLTAKPHLR